MEISSHEFFDFMIRTLNIKKVFSKKDMTIEAIECSLKKDFENVK
tara:strand:+ start:2012 stop:2146 length:135 start_codon:yes stop_codon:yes gene_type:complete